MNELSPLIRDLAIILGVASIVTLLFQRINQPVVLGYLIAGIIVGPHTPPYTLVKDIPNIQTLSELGVIFLMFSLGLDFSFHKLKRVGFSSSMTGVIEVILMLGLGFATGLSLGWAFNDSLFLGAALAISSTTIIIKALEELHLKHKRFAELIFGILIVEDLLAILLLVALSTVILTNDIISYEMGWAAIKLVLVVGGWFLVGYLLVPTLLRRIIQYSSEETLTIVAIALCLFLVCIAAYFHYSAALGAFIMGSILAETAHVQRIEQLIHPIRNIFAAVFFVSVGMLINPKIIFDNFAIVMLITLITIFGKIISTGIGSFLTGQSINTSVRIGFSMAQIGELSFIIVGLGTALHAITPKLFPIIVAVSVITTFTTPYFIRLSGYISSNMDHYLSTKLKYLLESYTIWVYRSRANHSGQKIHHTGIIRLILNAIIVAIIFILTEHLILPEIDSLIEDYLYIDRALAWLCALILSSPFIWAMLTTFKHPKHRTKKRAARPIPFLLSVFIVIAEIIILSVAYFHTWVVTWFLIIMSIVFFALLYKKLEKSYQWFEDHLLKNLQTSSLRQSRYEELAPWDTHLVEVHVSPHSSFVNKSLQELQLREDYNINIVAIYRNAEVILVPSASQIILAFDKLITLGTDDQIEKFRKLAEVDKKMEIEEPDLLASFCLSSVYLDEHHPAVGKSIRNSKIRKKVRGLVVGLERDGKRILNPHSNRILKSGDLLLIVGDTEHAVF